MADLSMTRATPPPDSSLPGVPPREEWPPGAKWVGHAPNSGEYIFGYTGDGSRSPRGPVTHVRLSPDYGAPSPLWPNSVEIEELVSSGLLEQLMEWQLAFEQHFDDENGWTSPEVKARWADQAVVLERELRLEFGPDVEIEVELWPIEPDDRTAP